MRILLISQFFDPEPTVKGLLFARALAHRGHEVEVVTGFPNYPGGRLYPGYDLRVRQREYHDNVCVWRVPLYPSHDQSFVRRFANYVSFAASASILGIVLTRKPDVVYVYQPPATVGLVALTQRLVRHVPVVYDIQDLWPDTLRATGMLHNAAALGAVGLWCDFIYKRATRLVVLSPGFRERLVDRGVPESKIDVIYNWCDEEAIKPTAPDHVLGDQLGLSSSVFTVLFAGNMGLAQALDVVLGAAVRLAIRLPAVRFVLIGGGVDRARLEAAALELRLSNVRFIDERPMHAMGPVLALADALLVHLRDDPLFHITIPSKTQAYLAAGKPVLMGVRGDAGALIEEAGAGCTFTPEDPEALANAIAAIAGLSATDRARMGAAGLAFYQQRLSLAAGVEAFESTFERALTS
jgi:glycosyltransferase involved in cell wall biosynthesis